MTGDLIVGVIAGVVVVALIAALAIARRHQRFMIRVTFEVEREDELERQDPDQEDQP